MKCTKCNTENKNNAKFCVKCGAPLNKSKQKYNLKVIGIIIAVIIVIICAYFVLSSFTGTIEASYPTMEVEGVTFTIPEEGYYKEHNKYRFNFTNITCSIKSVKSFEEVPEGKTIKSVKLEKYYPGAETYTSHYESSGETWYGLKIKKDGVWFHISSKTDDKQAAMRYFDWIYEHNDWEGHK